MSSQLIQLMLHTPRLSAPYREEVAGLTFRTEVSLRRRLMAWPQDLLDELMVVYGACSIEGLVFVLRQRLSAADVSVKGKEYQVQLRTERGRQELARLVKRKNDADNIKQIYLQYLAQVEGECDDMRELLVSFRAKTGVDVQGEPEARWPDLDAMSWAVLKNRQDKAAFLQMLATSIVRNPSAAPSRRIQQLAEQKNVTSNDLVRHLSQDQAIQRQEVVSCDDFVDSSRSVAARDPVLYRWMQMVQPGEASAMLRMRGAGQLHMYPKLAQPIPEFDDSASDEEHEPDKDHRQPPSSPAPPSPASPSPAPPSPASPSPGSAYKFLSFDSDPDLDLDSDFALFGDGASGAVDLLADMLPSEPKDTERKKLQKELAALFAHSSTLLPGTQEYQDIAARIREIENKLA